MRKRRIKVLNSKCVIAYDVKINLAKQNYMIKYFINY